MSGHINIGSGKRAVGSNAISPSVPRAEIGLKERNGCIN